MQGKMVHECTAAATIYSFAVCSFYTMVHHLRICWPLYFIHICIAAYIFIWRFVALSYQCLFCLLIFKCWSWWLSYRKSVTRWVFFSSGENKLKLCYPNPSSNDLEEERKQKRQGYSEHSETTPSTQFLR